MYLTNFKTKTYSFVQYNSSNKEHEKLFESITSDELSESFFKNWKNLFNDNDNNVINALVVEKKEKAIGITTLVQQSDNDYILSYIVAPQYRGNNYSSQIITELLNYLFENDDIDDIVSYIDKNNKNSISSMLKTKPDKIICDYNNENMLKVVYKNKKLKGEINNGKSR